MMLSGEVEQLNENEKQLRKRQEQQQREQREKDSPPVASNAIVPLHAFPPKAYSAVELKCMMVHTITAAMIEGAGALPAELLALLSPQRAQLEPIGMLGQGGFGQVMLYRSRLDRRYTAVKQIRFNSPLAPWSPHSDGRFEQYHHKILREVRALSTLSATSPFVVRYLNCWIESDWTKLGKKIVAAQPNQQQQKKQQQQKHQSRRQQQPCVPQTEESAATSMQRGLVGNGVQWSGSATYSGSSDSDQSGSENSSSSDEVTHQRHLSATHNSAFTFGEPSHSAGEASPPTQPSSLTAAHPRSRSRRRCDTHKQQLPVLQLSLSAAQPHGTAQPLVTAQTRRRSRQSCEVRASCSNTSVSTAQGSDSSTNYESESSSTGSPVGPLPPHFTLNPPSSSEDTPPNHWPVGHRFDSQQQHHHSHQHRHQQYQQPHNQTHRHHKQHHRQQPGGKSSSPDPLNFKDQNGEGIKRWPYILNISMDPVPGVTLDVWLAQRNAFMASQAANHSHNSSKSDGQDGSSSSSRESSRESSSSSSSKSSSRGRRNSRSQLKPDSIGSCLGPMEQSIFAQIVMGLVHVHAGGIVHRDLKPSNIFVTPVVGGEPAGVQVLISDFGLSSISGMHGSPSSTDISRSSSAEADGPVEGTLNRDEYQEGGMLNRGEYQETVAGSSEMRGGQQGAKGHGVEDRWKKEGDAGLLGATRMSSSSFHTRTTRIGTPTYCAPEQLGHRGSRRSRKGQYGPEVDIYPLGLILMELACPFTTGMERAKAMQRAQPGKANRAPPSASSKPSSPASSLLPRAMTQSLPGESALAARLLAPHTTARPTAPQVLTALTMLWGVEEAAQTAPVVHALNSVQAWKPSTSMQPAAAPAVPLVGKRPPIADAPAGPSIRLLDDGGRKGDNEESSSSECVRVEREGSRHLGSSAVQRVGSVGCERVGSRGVLLVDVGVQVGSEESQQGVQMASADAEIAALRQRVAELEAMLRVKDVQ